MPEPQLWCSSRNLSAPALNSALCKLGLLDGEASTLWTCGPFMLVEDGKGAFLALPGVLNVWQVGHLVFILKVKVPHSLCHSFWRQHRTPIHLDVPLTRPQQLP